MVKKGKNKENIIYIKKVVKKEAGHTHAGMWKVAYADFITAMMCFFLLMWLISTTPQDKLEGLAQYFATKSGSRVQGTGEEDAKDRGIAPKTQPKQLLNSTTGEQIFDAEQNNLLAEEKQNFINTMNSVKKDKTLQEFSENIVWDITSEGLRIQITDTNNRPMFKPDTAELAPYMKRILNAVSSMIVSYPNYISITGHTASMMNISSDMDYWALSAMRANEVRRFLSATLKPDQVVRIMGKADKEPLIATDPFSSQNARITITLLRNGSVSKYQQSVPEKSFYKK